MLASGIRTASVVGGEFNYTPACLRPSGAGLDDFQPVPLKFLDRKSVV